MTTDSLTYLSINKLSTSFTEPHHVNHIIETADRIPVISTAEHLDTLESLDELN